MAISFIVTTFNIEQYVDQCLSSLMSCVRAGDQVVIVDDGSSDDTVPAINRVVAANRQKDVEVTTAFLGVNTFGGVGIAGNIGMDLATRDTIFFVDGDDFIETEGFVRARRVFESSDADVLICNYLEYDERNAASKHPADHHKWAGISNRPDAEKRRLMALDLIAVPWRKFYRRSMITQNRIRYPEGDFFFEDNPFHWRICRAARNIIFCNEVICHHRINRPGQTMTSTGHELAAFFTHFRTIFGEIPQDQREHRELACRWLVNNVTWHLDRLKPEAMWRYLSEAARTFATIPDDIWYGPLQDYFALKIVWPTVEALRAGKVWEVGESLRARQRFTELRAIGKKAADDIAALKMECRRIGEDSKIAREIVQAQRYIDEYEALLRIAARGQ